MFDIKCKDGIQGLRNLLLKILCRILKNGALFPLFCAFFVNWEEI